MKVETNADGWPIYRVTILGDVNAEDAEVLVRALAEPIQRRERYVAVVDASVLGATTHEAREVFSRRLKEHDADFVRFNIGTVVVVRSALVRGLMATLNVLYRWATPNRFVSTLTEANRIAASWLADDRAP